MNKYVKGAFIFTGGVAVGIGVAGGLALSSRDVRKLIGKKIADVLLDDLEYQSKKSYHLLFDTLDDARSILKTLQGNLLSGKFDEITIADYLELAGVKHSFADTKLGWKDLTTACVVQVTGGYTILFPTPVPLTII